MRWFENMGFEVRVDGRCWVKASRQETAKAAAEAAEKRWAKGRKIEIIALAGGRK